MPPFLRAGAYELDFDDLYARMWGIATDDRGDGSRLYAPQPLESLKWLIEGLAGTPARSGETLSENNEIRQQTHRVLRDEGWAERLTGTRFRLLRPPLQDDEFATLHTVMSVIPEGRWTTYGDVGSLVEVHPRGLGGHIKTCSSCPNAVRVLPTGGQPHGSGFRWTNRDRRDDPNDVLEREGVRFEDGRAAPEQYLPASELDELWRARRATPEPFEWPTIEWVKAPIDLDSEQPNGSPIRMRHFLDCPHWYRDSEHRLLGEPPLLATDDQMRTLQPCLTCLAKAELANNPNLGTRIVAEADAVPSIEGGRTPSLHDIATDAVAVIAVRREQRFLREHLLGDRAEAPCAICGRVLPRGLLVAAHIAPRSTLNEAERLDFAAAAMLACALGCDALFERGYIAVDGTGQLIMLREPETDALSHRIIELVGRRVQAFDLATAPRFARHRTLHQV